MSDDQHNDEIVTPAILSSNESSDTLPSMSSSTTNHGDLSLNPSQHSREIVRLVQCPQCSYPICNPMTLPCGNSLCRNCLPKLHERTNITYFSGERETRIQGFTCPFADCQQEHAIGDCSMDVTLSKVMGIIKTHIDDFRPEKSDTPMLLEEKDKWALAGVASLSGNSARSQVLEGGRLVATYTMAEKGLLAYDSEVTYTPLSPTTDYKSLDVAVLDELNTSTWTELDCQVCYAVFLDPITTTCGHTFCRKCLQRVLDHSKYCPICRFSISTACLYPTTRYPANKRLQSLLKALYSDVLASRLEAVKLEDMSHVGDSNTPLFVCSLSFPNMPTFLHIFEPRYRLMIRRAMETNRSFGMLLANQDQIPQGELGSTNFYQYGTLLYITNNQMLPDGRSVIETRGTERFRVVNHGVLDGYLVGQIERVHDISNAEEEALEISETSQLRSHHPSPSPDIASSPSPSHEDSNTIPQPQIFTPQSSISPSPEPYHNDLDALPTSELMRINTDFVNRMLATQAPWLASRFRRTFGECPSDPALFPWWFGSIVPVPMTEKYKLLPTRSVRERLKICVGWVRVIDGQRW
jgi:hypothetical protein